MDAPVTGAGSFVPEPIELDLWLGYSRYMARIFIYKYINTCIHIILKGVGRSELLAPLMSFLELSIRALEVDFMANTTWLSGCVDFSFCLKSKD